MLCVVHVDNFHVGTNDSRRVAKFFKDLKNVEFIKSESTSILGVHVVNPSPGIFTFNMEFYILKVCEKFIQNIDKPKVKIPITITVVEKHLKKRFLKLFCLLGTGYY